MYEFVFLIIIIGLVIWNYSKIKQFLLPHLLENKRKQHEIQQLQKSEIIKQQMHDLEQSPKLSHIERWNQIIMDLIQLPCDFFHKLGISYGIFSAS